MTSRDRAVLVALVLVAATVTSGCHRQKRTGGADASAGGQTVTCMGTGEKVQLRCQGDACAKLGPEIVCPDRYLDLRNTKINNWVKDGKWASRQNRIAIVAFDVVKPEQRGGRTCGKADAEADVHLCLKTGDFSDTSFIGLVTLVNYKEGVMTDDLDAQPITLAPPERQQNLPGALAFYSATKRTDVAGALRAFSLYDEAKTPGAKQMMDEVAASLQLDVASLKQKSDDARAKAKDEEDARKANRTPLEVFADDSDAISREELEKLTKGKEWALYPAGTTACSIDPETKAPHSLTTPSGKNEFEVRRLASDRSKIAAEVIGKIVKFEGSGNAISGFRIDDDLALKSSKYDVAAHRYTLVLSAHDSGKWPLIGPDPTFSARGVSDTRDIEVGKVEGKSLTVSKTVGMNLWENVSTLKFPMPMKEAEAEELVSTMPAHVLVVTKFVGLGYHRVCEQQCMTVLGVPGCDMMDTGFRDFVRATLLGYEIRVGNKVIAQKQPPPVKK